jgi:hypothetical protein
LDRPVRAQHLLSDEFFQEIINSYQQEQIDRFKNSSEFDFELRESAYRNLMVLEEIIGRIKSVAAQKEIEKKRWKIL